MKVKNITIEMLADYLRISELDMNSEDILDSYLQIAKEYIKNYTGLDMETIEESVDFSIVIFVLVQDMYDNRAMYIDKTNINRVVQSVLDQHRSNLL